MGVRVKLTKLVNLDIGYTMHYTDADNLNGFTYWNVPLGHSSTVHKDKFSYTHVGLEIALGKKSKPQLLFDNPAARLNNSLQSQINSLTVKVDSLMNKQKSLDDTDGDGVADLFDKEPNTPPGCPVDAQGMLRDTDGDGVVDCKDKQLITPTECQPVDADGVGKCPDPACCKGRTGDGDTDADGNLNANCPSDYPALSFRGNSINLSNETRAIIAVIATKMKARPDCKIMIKGNAETSKSSQAVCQKRVDAIRKQLREKEGISAERITTNCEVGGAGDKNVVEISTN
jgi:outer membrane protein OmpA-like peptidoglycan-associated protein